jgi:uncharacterized protein
VKVFLDTNVLVAAIATRGLCSELFEAVLQYHELVTCREVLVELDRALREKLKLPGPRVKGYLELIGAEAQIAESREPLSPPVKDRDDIPILACAVGGAADVFVTGDAELLRLERISDLPILSPRQFWTRLAGLADR